MRIAAFASPLAALLMCACASPGEGTAMGRTLEAGAAISLGRGETANLPDHGSLHYIGVQNDSRCPPGAQCIRAGDADAIFEYRISPSGASRPVVLNTDHARSAALGAWTLTLVNLGAGADGAAEVRIDPAR